MKKLNIKQLLVAGLALTALSACHKEKQNPANTTPTAQRAGVYILNQGGFGSNNGSLTYYDYTSKNITPDIFTSANPTVTNGGQKSLGDTPNDIKISGSKMYIVVNVSNYLEVADAKTAKEIKHITFPSDSEPRDIVFNKNKAFISCYNGTVAVLDTASLTIDKYITVGANPEQMVISNNKLYVANSGGLQLTPANTVSVVDLNTLTETKKITVIASPVTMGTDNYGHVYAFSTGTYTGTVAPGLSIIDNSTDAVVSQNAISAAFNTQFILNGDLAYFITSDNKVMVYNTKTQTTTSTNFITDGTAITAAYGLGFDSTTGEVFVTDAKNYSSNGALFAFDKTGKKEYSITTGINPCAVAFVNK